MPFEGKIIKRDENLYIIKPSTQEAYKIFGDDAKKIELIFKNYDSNIDFNNLAQKLNIDIQEINSVFDSLEQVGFYTPTPKKLLNILILTDFINVLDLRYFKTLEDSIKIKVTQVSDIDDYLIDVDYIIAVSVDNNNKFYKNVEDISILNNIPWIHTSISQDKIYLGPTFFMDGGPCYHCYYTRKIFNQSYSEHIFNPKAMSELLISYIKKILYDFANKSSDTSILSGREIAIDVENFEINKTRVLRMPHCEKCAEKRSLQVLYNE